MAQAFDFDRVIDRRGTDSIKFDFAVEHGLPADVLPLWVADMDFRAPLGVLDAIHACADHGIFGYGDIKPDYFEAVGGWFERRFGFATRPEWLITSPGVVFALAMAVRALTRPGDAVLIQPPVYPPFYRVVRSNGRRVVENPLVLKDGRYEIDFEGLERAIVENKTALFILCSPHNPVGRVWTRPELERIGEICRRHGVIVASDEIHCDFTYPGHPHTPFALAVPDMAERSVICTAPSKTFNLAGLQASNIWASGADIREKLRAEISACGYGQLNNIALAACKAAYRTGEAWLDALLVYLRGNVDFLRGFLREELPMLRLIEPEATYLAWVDFSALGLDPGALDELIVQKARLWLDAGGIFGRSGAQFQRIVLACPRSTLKQALVRLKGAMDAM